MADPLLTSLCAICHISTPQYKCPRCGLRTCSLPCVKKHKAWSDCSGERDATKYLPPSKLRTPAGIDHDYNFLHGIERSVESAERLLIGERGLVQEEELRPLTVQEVRWKPGRDGRKRKVIVTRVLREAKGRTFERFLSQRLKKLNIEILCAPIGMRRMKENNTTLNRRTGRINWQVEWMTFDGEVEDEEGELKPKISRTLSKVMDDVPLYQAYHSFLGELETSKSQQHPKKTLRAPPGASSWQSPPEVTWRSTPYPLQDPGTGRWTTHHGAAIDMWPAEKDATQRGRFQYLLARPRQRSDEPTVLTQLEPGSCLRDILTNTRVLEFPTVYVLKAEESLPTGFVIGPKDVVPPPQNAKRKDPPGKKNAQGRFAKKRRGGEKDIEEGEVKSDGEEHGDDNGQGTAAGVGFEAGDVIAEQSFGEEGSDGDDDDETSSSGSDSDSE